MEEPTIVESKRQKKTPPPRPPPPSSHKKTDHSSPADRIPRSQTVSGDMPRRPKQPPGYPARRGGSPVSEKTEKLAAGNTSPVPPPRRRKKQQLVFPENNPNSDVREGFINTNSKDFTSKEDAVEGDRPLMETQERSARSLSSGVRPSTKRKEAQNMAKMKGILVQDVDNGAPCLKCNEKCTGFSLHVWRSRCNSCGCPRTDHKIAGTAKVDIPYLSHLKFGDVLIESSSPALSQLEWYPPDLTDEQVMLYMSQLPKDVIPKRGSKGAAHRNQQYLLQLCDSNKTIPSGLSEKETGRWKKFYERLMFSASGVGKVVVHSIDGKRKVCFTCFEQVQVGDVYVTATEQFGEGSSWHPQCFKCTECNELLVDLVYFFSEQEQAIYCGRHQAELIIPRCAACDQLIFNDTFTKAKGKTWHKEHFCCWQCDKELHGKTYVEENKHFYCINCYDELFADKCIVCNKPISVGQSKIQKNNQFYHGECYCCTSCNKKLMGQTVFTKGDEMVCESCATGGKTMACIACHDRVLPTDRYVGSNNEFWHSRCFTCLLCNLSLVDQPFMKHQGNPLCLQCYDGQNSTRCAACDKPITDKGVKYKEQAYHSSCFVCTGCERELSGISFINHNHQPYCKQCHTKRFAKVCNVCNEAIVGKCTSYGDKNYHAACFRCENCYKTISSTTFYEDNHGKILCAHCGEK